MLASDVAPFSQQVTDGVNGLLVPPDDERALAGALRRLGDPEVRRRLADGVQTPDLSGPWAHYLGTIEALSLDESLLGPGPEPHAQAPATSADATDVGDDATAREPRRRRGVCRPAGFVCTAGFLAGQAPGTGRGATPRRTSPRRVGTTMGRTWATLAGGDPAPAAPAALASRRDVLDLRPEDVPDWVLADRRAR